MLARSCASCDADPEMATITFTPQAAEQLAQARDWWLAHRDKAPHAFDEDLDELLVRLEQQPTLVGRPLDRASSVRRAHLRRIRYYAYFEVLDDGEQVVFVGLWHASRSGSPEL